MKKIFFSITALVAGLFLLSSCSDFLKESPRSSLTYQDYFKSEAHVLGNLNYPVLRPSSLPPELMTARP